MRAAVDPDAAVLLLSGGVDSTTLLAELAGRGMRVVALTFEYGQRHGAEVLAAAELARAYNVAEHLCVRVQLPGASASALLFDGPRLPTYDGALPTGPVETYVPMRNLIFISHAASLAEARGIGRVLVGFNRDDATNYWDCSAAFVERANAVLALSSFGRVRVEAPLIALSKAEVVARARALGVPTERTISCYQPADGSACNRCLACRLRQSATPEG